MASEEERGQTGCLRRAGVEEQREMTIGEANGLERPARDGDSPVAEAENSELDPEYRGTREILREAGGTTPQA